MYIEKIKSPADLKKLDLKELQVVADETRQAVLNRVSKHGGHVGPNLGFVEATVALHYVFNAPKDKLVFDVSHQCYPHKVLTGRAAGFLGDVNDMNAISGYSSPAECPEYDNFEVGHTSTSVSLATGLQKARDVKGTDENIIAIIGDGSLSGGEAFEGLDEASELGTGIIIVVNDNEMSIAENHGGIYKNLRALRQSNGTCEHNWFKAWGFEYKYLEEGNDIEKLIQVFESVKDTDKPTVVHIHTEKGHGFAPAVANKEAWHWGMPFNLEDGSRPRRNADGTLPEVAPTEDYGTLFSDWMLSEMKQDKTLIAVIGDGSLSGGEAFEGLDEASELGTGIIIVVNDNEMSIAENHGGIYKNLRALRESNGTCEHNWFKAWGFEYKYLEEGNDIEKLIEVFESVKDTDKPTVVHIHTEKGHGFAPAVANKEAWHWGMPFNLEDGSRPRKNADGTIPVVTPMEDYGTLFADWMLSEMKQDKTLIAVTAGTPTAGGFTADKRKLAGKQHIDMGIAEEQAVAMISGMAKGGLHPVWTVYSTFIQRTYDQIAQDLCINSNPAVINVVGGGVNSMNDITHICLFDIPMLCSIPGLIYLAPTTCEEYFAMLRWSIQQDKKPIAIRVPSNGVVHASETVDAEYGYESKYKVMHQGEKVAIIAAGSFYQKGENVARLLADKGIDATLINPRYLNEVDAETLDSLKANHQLVVTLEDGSKDGGFGERIASYYGTSDMKVMVGGIRKGLYDRFDVQQLLSDNRLLDEQIVEDVLNNVKC